MTTTAHDTPNPYLSGLYAPVHDERDDTLAVRGELPAALTGVFMRNGANPQFDPLGAYHIFDGDGMVHAIYLDEGRARYRNRWVESKGLAAEREAGEALFGGLSNPVFPPPEVMERAGMLKNTANTNIVRHAGHYLALMEASPPTAIDRDLNTLGEFDFDGALRGPMTAHPRLDAATGDLHFFGYSPFPPHLRYHVAGADGTLRTSVDIDMPRPTMMHDFVLSERYAIFFDMPAVFDLEAMLSGGAGIQWQPEHGARIGLLNRAQPADPVTWIEIDPCYVFHFFNAYDTPDGEVVIDACRAPELPTAFGDDELPDANVFPSLHRWIIDPTAGHASMTQISDAPTDFPRINERFTGAQHRFGYTGHVAEWTPHGVIFDGITRVDFANDTEHHTIYGPHHAAGEPVFAADPDSDAEDAGWILNFVTDRHDESTTFVVHDARDLDGGPVAELPLPRRVPFGFHGNWMPDPGA